MRNFKDAFSSLNTLQQDYKASLQKTSIPVSTPNFKSDYYLSSPEIESILPSRRSSVYQSPFPEPLSAQRRGGALEAAIPSLSSQFAAYTPIKKEEIPQPVPDLDTIIRMKRDLARQQIQNLQKTDFYRLLGVSVTASEEEISKAYKRLCLKHHPDKPGGDADKFQQINKAYKVLLDKELRDLYDQFGLEYIETYLTHFC